MVLNVELDIRDNLECHDKFLNLFKESGGGMDPIRFSGMFRLSPDFEVSYAHISEMRGHGRTTKFKLMLVGVDFYAELVADD